VVLVAQVLGQVTTSRSRVVSYAQVHPGFVVVDNVLKAWKALTFHAQIEMERLLD